MAKIDQIEPLSAGTNELLSIFVSVVKSAKFSSCA